MKISTSSFSGITFKNHLFLILLNIEWTHKRKNSHYISMIR
ncbi:hypothetical protein D1AOALGA4SA_3868 [Olavius algarvensis Delta 1 endosymbiont]|nr:hypothetical protein D1AOALGA4SA_3868 [Olavius algarvensis Delta 1 endosymbiont]